MSTTIARALVAVDPAEGQSPGDNWELQEISVPSELNDFEVLIEMAASGICHTDLITTSFPVGTPGFIYPRIAGHEGSGYVKAIGPKVKKNIKVGDPVLLSFDYCGECDNCVNGKITYCATFTPKNILGVEDMFKTKDGKPISGKAFGQSSFASLSVVNEACVLPAKDLIKSKDELHLFAPLGCGIQTGAGAILNIAKAEKDDRVMVLGLGGVGLSAVMGAKIAGARQIVAVDKVKSRLELAKSFGATDAVDTTGVEDLVSKFKEVTGGLGPTVVVDILQAGYDSIAAKGRFVFVGASGKPDYKLNIDITTHMMNGTRLMGCCEGESVPSEVSSKAIRTPVEVEFNGAMQFIPRLIEAYRDGKLPIDKIAKIFKADDFKTALHEMHTGETIKPIILW